MKENLFNLDLTSVIPTAIIFTIIPTSYRKPENVVKIFRSYSYKTKSRLSFRQNQGRLSILQRPHYGKVSRAFYQIDTVPEGRRASHLRLEVSSQNGATKPGQMRDSPPISD